MLDGRTYRDLGAFHQISGAIWSNTNPNKLYGVDAQGNGNRLYSQNATSGALTVLRAFSGFRYITIGDDEGGVSDDDRYIVLFGYPSSGGKHIVVYDLIGRTVVADRVAPAGTDNVQISRKGNYVVVVGAAPGATPGIWPRASSSTRTGTMATMRWTRRATRSTSPTLPAGQVLPAVRR